MSTNVCTYGDADPNHGLEVSSHHNRKTKPNKLGVAWIYRTLSHIEREGKQEQTQAVKQWLDRHAHNAIEFRISSLVESSSLADIFKCENTKESFLKFLNERADSEMLLNSISFIEAVERYRNLREATEARELAHDIMRFFIHDIKLNGTTLSRLQYRISNDAIAPNMFDDAAGEALGELGGAPAREFRLSLPHMELHAAKLDAQETLLEAGWTSSEIYRSISADVIGARDVPWAKHRQALTSMSASLWCLVTVASKTYRCRARKDDAMPTFEQRLEFPLLSTTEEVRIELVSYDLVARRQRVFARTHVKLAEIVHSVSLPRWYPLCSVRPLKDSGVNLTSDMSMSSLYNKGTSDLNDYAGEIHIRFALSHVGPSLAGTQVVKDLSGSKFTGAIRNKVSKKKRRFEDDGFSLDLSYITDRIVAMGFPSEGTEGLYRNPMSQVQVFFRQRHRDRYMIYNLCSERTYDAAKFEQRVRRFPMDDHNPCAFEQLVEICTNMAAELDGHPQNVVCVHCKAGKGRTGLVICAFLLYSRHSISAQHALRFYGMKRTTNGKGVTIPSQRRFVSYMERYVTLPDSVPRARSLRLHCLRVYDIGGGIKPDTVYFTTLELGASEEFSSRSVTFVQTDPELQALEFRLGVSDVPSLSDDVKVSVCTLRGELFHFWFNTRFVNTDSLELRLNKNELDGAVKDKTNKLFPPTLRVVAFFKQVPNEQSRAAVHSISCP